MTTHQPPEKGQAMSEPETVRLSVNLHPEVSAVLVGIAARDQTNVTEAVRRVIGLRHMVDQEHDAGRRVMVVDGTGDSATFRELVLRDPADGSPRDADAAAVDPMGGNVPGGDPARVAKYAEAIDSTPDTAEPVTMDWRDWVNEAASVIAIADSEHAALVEEIRSMGRDALAEAQAYRALFAENERLREAAEAHWDARTLECPECGSGEEGCCVCSQMKRAEAAEAALAEARAQVERMREALEFYADPDTYFAVGFMFDRPCGDFADDFDEGGYEEYGREMPGKRAREALSSAAADTPEARQRPEHDRLAAAGADLVEAVGPCGNATDTLTISECQRRPQGCGCFPTTHTPEPASPDTASEGGE